MDNVNMFEFASRNKLRFETVNGILSVEDLWDLPLTSTRRANLDDIAKELNRKIKESSEESFVTPKAADKESAVAFEIVKHVIGVKMAENEAVRVSAEKKRQRERILEIIAQKQDEELKGKGLEELKSLLDTY